MLPARVSALLGLCFHSPPCFSTSRFLLFPLLFSAHFQEFLYICMYFLKKLFFVILIEIWEKKNNWK